MRESKQVSMEANSILDQTNQLIDEKGINSDGFQAIYNLWITRVYQFVYARIGNIKDSEDITSRIFLKAYEGFPRYKHRGHFSAWLFTIARNEIKMFYRGRKIVELTLDLNENIGSVQDMLEETINSGEIDQIRGLIGNLPDKEKELIYLRYVAELKFSEMAVVLGRKESAVKKSLYRLQARMQDSLEENYE